ncbi:MAG: hypothetical protein ISS29_04385 [Candidatus Marinimicrobia bacterium]|nr:hypothetical protein [Candidatus Neomarinimicrobiota bacterium]
MKKVYLFMLLLLFFIRCELFESSEEHDNANIDYPIILYPLSESELNELQLELDSLLNSHYKATLDEYGFIGPSGLLSRGSSSINDVNYAVSKAKSAVVAFSQFTNVSDTSKLIVSEATNQHGTNLFNDWIVSFQNQAHDTIEVLKTNIMVLITDNIVQVDGHHYGDIVVPENNLISSEEAEESVIGAELIYYGYAEVDTFIVTEDAIHIDNAKEETSIKILPYEQGDSLEMRVCWRVPIFGGSIYPDFYVFVDILSGEVITYWTLFIC